MLIIYVGLAGAAGAVTRYALSVAGSAIAGSAFPLGTLGCNVLGSFVLAYLFSLAVREKLSASIRTAMGTGFIGAFTTFSTFSVEVLNYMQAGRTLAAVIYALLSAAAGLAAVWAGWETGRKFPAPAKGETHD